MCQYSSFLRNEYSFKCNNLILYLSVAPRCYVQEHKSVKSETGTGKDTYWKPLKRIVRVDFYVSNTWVNNYILR